MFQLSRSESKSSDRDPTLNTAVDNSDDRWERRRLEISAMEQSLVFKSELFRFVRLAYAKRRRLRVSLEMTTHVKLHG